MATEKGIKLLKKKGEHCLPIFCLNCYQHSWKNCYGENPCTPVRLLTRVYPLDEKSRQAMLILQELYFKTPFEVHEKWSKKRKCKEIFQLSETERKDEK